MAKRKRIAALVLAVLICCALLISACFIADEADHDCTGDNCAICAMISLCEGLMRHLGAIVLVCAAVCAARCVCVMAGAVQVCGDHATPVTLRVKLSN